MAIGCVCWRVGGAGHRRVWLLRRRSGCSILLVGLYRTASLSQLHSIEAIVNKAEITRVTDKDLGSRPSGLGSYMRIARRIKA